MNYLDLDGKQHKINLTKSLEQKLNKSKLHLSTRRLLKKLFPSFIFLEECRINIYDKQFVFFDFLIPDLRLAVEPCGKQHFFHTPHFHTKSEFLKAKQRDVLKQQWCDLNNFRLVNLNYNESEADWSKKLNDTI